MTTDARRRAYEIADRSFDQGVQPQAWKSLANAIEHALIEYGNARLELAVGTLGYFESEGRRAKAIRALKETSP